MNTFSIESILFKDMYTNSNNNTSSNTKVVQSLDDCIYDAYKSSEDLKFYETYTMLNDYNNTQKLRMLNKLRYATNNIKNKQAHNSCESYIRSIEEDSNSNTTENVEKKKNWFIRFFTMIGKAIKKFFGLIRSTLKRFIDWILRKNKNNDNEQFVNNNSPKALPEPESSSTNEEPKENIQETNNVKNNDEYEKQKAERRKKFEEKRDKQIDEMRRLDEISKKNGEYQTMKQRMRTNDINTTYSGNKADVKTLNDFKQSVKDFKEKYDIIISLDSIINQETIIDLLYKCCNGCYKNVEQSKGDVKVISNATKNFSEFVKSEYEQNADLKNINNALIVVFGKSIAIRNNKKISEDELIRDPKVLDKLADDKVISYFKKLTSDQEKKLKELEKLSDDFVKLCIKMVNDPRIGSTGIMGTKLNEKKATYNESEINKMETHSYLIYLKQTMNKWNDVTSKYNIALTTIYNYFLDVQKLRMSVRTYLEKSNGFKK